MRHIGSIYILFTVAMLLALRALPARAIDWPDFMAKQDMVWDQLPLDWAEAPFSGNGTLGAYLVYDSGENAVRMEIGNSLVHDHRREADIYGRGRLLIGSFLLRPKGKILSGECRVDFWNAEIRGTLRTTIGDISFRQYTPSESPYLVMEARTSGSETVVWEFSPAKADSPRQLKASLTPGHPHFKNDYLSNPSPIMMADTREGVCRQPLLEGGETATVWKVITGDGVSTLVASVEHTYPDSSASAAAIRNLKSVTSATLEKTEKAHRKWWHSFFRASFVSLPDKRIENFYWAQIYKLGSATHPEGCLIDNCGPWLTETPWPNAWWNLNVQLAYWPLLASNHLELNGPLIKLVTDNIANLIDNVPPEFRHDSAALPVATDFTLSGRVRMPGEKGSAQIGCLPWLCHNLWLHYRHSMDSAFLRETLYPLLRRSVNLYLHFLQEGADGLLHLPATYSPEYDSTEDCNFDLSLLKWGCETLVESARLLGIDDPLLPRWQDVSARLVPFPQNNNGIMIGRDTPYAKSHRHYSHLLMFYPLYLINADQPGAYELMDRSVRHWHSIPGNILAYSFTGASSMYASFGNGAEALRHLRSAIAQPNLCPNTMYRESGPVIETPLSGAKCVQDMLLQSWGGKIRVFPAIPAEWADVSFADLRAEGAFLVSATRLDGVTKTITIKSLAGEPCIIVTDMPDPRPVGSDITITPLPKNPEITSLSNQNVYRIDLPNGVAVTITPSGIPVSVPAEIPGSTHNHYGSAKRG